MGQIEYNDSNLDNSMEKKHTSRGTEDGNVDELSVSQVGKEGNNQ